MLSFHGGKITEGIKMLNLKHTGVPPTHLPSKNLPPLYPVRFCEPIKLVTTPYAQFQTALKI
jgi:hypothetical protein